MLTADEIRSKVRELEIAAENAGEAAAAAYRQLAMRWRLLEVDAVFMETIETAMGHAEPDRMHGGFAPNVVPLFPPGDAADS
jgi:hypothetical protein